MTTSPSLKTIANVLGIVLLIALVAPFVVYAVPGVVGADHSFVVLTASMTPAIAPGDVVIVADRDPTTIADGDVITFVRGDNEVPVTHRVIDVIDGPSGLAFETQGDANGAPDASAVPAANVIGVVTITIPYIGYVIQFADSPAGFIALIVVPFGLLALSEAWNVYRARREDGAATVSAAETTETDGAQETDDTTVTATADVDGESAAGTAASSGFVVTDRTVEGALLVLVPVVPYAAYVAYTLRTATTIAVATAALMTTLIALALYAAGRRGASGGASADAEAWSDAESEATRARSGPTDADPATDGGEALEADAFETDGNAELSRNDVGSHDVGSHDVDPHDRESADDAQRNTPEDDENPESSTTERPEGGS